MIRLRKNLKKETGFFFNFRPKQVEDTLGLLHAASYHRFLDLSPTQVCVFTKQRNNKNIIRWTVKVLALTCNIDEGEAKYFSSKSWVLCLKGAGPSHCQISFQAFNNAFHIFNLLVNCFF